MHAHHHWIFVALSLTVAVTGSWTALDLFQRVRTHSGAAKTAWLAVASTVMGISIWSMHFIAMLGFDPGSPVSYDPGLTAGSLVLAIGGTAGAFFTASLSASVPRLLTSGAAMGLAICAMHYVGMAALKTAASLGYRPGLVVLSLVIAVGAATAALWAARAERTLIWRGLAAVVLGVAIAGMHYSAMAALVLTPISGVPAELPGAPPVMLAIAVSAGTGVILFIALAASVHDQRQTLLEVLDAGGLGYWEFHPRSGQLSASARGKMIIGLSADAKIDQAAWRASLSPDAQVERDAKLASALRTGEDYSAEYKLADGRWVSLRGRVLKDRAGRPLKIAGVLIDVTERESAFAAVAESERRQRVLINELNHRVKNTLATIQAIALLTGRRATSVSEFVAGFQARLLALSATHNLLTAQGWEKAELQSLLEQEFRPYPSEQVHLAGPPVWVAAEQALALALIFHELATNAAKYGALSVSDGCVSVSWSQSGEAIELRWREQDGPPVAPPERAGFGSRLINTTVEGALRGRITKSYSMTGLEVDLGFQADPGTN